MENKSILRNAVAALFFILGIALIISVIFVIGKGKGLTQGKFKVEVLFRNVGGLAEGAPIRLAGVNIGTVASIDFLDKEIDGRRVKATLNIFRKYKKQLEKSTRFLIKTEGILGEKLVEIYVAQGQPSLDLRHPIIGEDPLDVQDLAITFASAAEAFTKTSNALNQADIQGLSAVLSDSAQSLQGTSQEINAVLTEMRGISRKSRRLLDRIEQRVIDGNLFKVF